MNGIENEMESMLVTAAKEGHRDAVGFHTSSKDNPPLIAASKNGNNSIVKMLIENGANINIGDKSCRTALHWAAIRGHEAIVQILLQNQANVDSQDEFGMTPLQLASSHGHNETVELLLQSDANINGRDGDGKTALHYAATNGHESLVTLFINGGANLTHRDKFNKTFLHSAYEKKLFKLIIKLVAEELDQKILNDIFQQDEYSLLWHACKDGHLNLVEVLMKQNPKLLNIKALDGTSPQFMAFIKGHRQIVNFFNNFYADAEESEKSGIILKGFISRRENVAIEIIPIGVVSHRYPIAINPDHSEDPELRMTLSTLFKSYSVNQVVHLLLFANSIHDIQLQNFITNGLPLNKSLALVKGDQIEVVTELNGLLKDCPNISRGMWMKLKERLRMGNDEFVHWSTLC